jgi:hypothetical protein
MFVFGNWWQFLWTNIFIEFCLKEYSIGFAWSPFVGFKIVDVKREGLARSRCHNPPSLMSWDIGDQDLEHAINRGVPAWIKYEHCYQGQANAANSLALLWCQVTMWKERGRAHRVQKSARRRSSEKRDKVVSSFWFFLSIGPRTIKRGSESLFGSLAQIISLCSPYLFLHNTFRLLLPS